MIIRKLLTECYSHIYAKCPFVTVRNSGYRHATDCGVIKNHGHKFCVRDLLLSLSLKARSVPQFRFT